tara:strand:+ start:210 stop:551 length:342 start_codon:yes stop_codon:yes gene_type:complete
MKISKIIFFGYMILIFIGSTIPVDGSEKLKFLHWDKSLHLLEYLIFGFLGYKVFSHIKYPKTFIILLGISFGYFNELWQIMIPGRSSSFLDALANTLGVTIGTFLSYMLTKKA